MPRHPARSVRSGAGFWLALLAVAGAAVVALPPRGRSVEGEVSVIDGDSLRIGDLELRLKGIDAPEMRQTCHRGGRPYRCGETARQALRAKVAGRALACRIDGRDRYGRALARCRIDGQDLGGWLVREGLAVGYRDYEREEAAARERRAGLWAGEFRRPSEWRRHQS